MWNAFERALRLIFTGDSQLWGIIGRTLQMSLMSSLVSLLLGGLLGIVIALNRFPLKGALSRIIKSLMGIPPVIMGLVVFILFSGTGLLGGLNLIFTMAAMVIAQVLLITPIVCGMTQSYAETLVPEIRANATGLRLSKGKTLLLTINECKYQFVSIYLMGFSRAIAEVGAVSLAGGSIANKTEVMTTAILDYTNMGNFGYALGLGLVLLVISLLVNAVVTYLQEKDDNNSGIKKNLRRQHRIEYR